MGNFTGWFCASKFETDFLKRVKMSKNCSLPVKFLLKYTYSL